MINTTKINQLDTANVYSSIKQLPNQIEQVMSDIEKLSYPSVYQSADVIAISGMGGSIYNYHVIASLFSKELNRPLVGLNSYELPSSLPKKTLFVGSSYSGSTEETIATTTQAIKNKYLVTALTAGGPLAELMKKHGLPYYQFMPRYNQSGQPRVGVGYMIFGAVLILAKLGYLVLKEKELVNSLARLKKNDGLIQKKADLVKDSLKETTVILVAAEHLAGVVHAGRNQINETAKALAEYHLIPELNHHLMEGLTYPKNKKLLFVFYNSRFYYERNQKRFAVTKIVLDKQKVPYLDVSFEADNKLEEFLFYLQFGSYLSFFLGIDYGVDPLKIPWVDYFKKELGK